MRNLEKIKKELKKLEPILKEKFKTKRIGIFGSYIKKKEKNRSDLDILIEFYEPIVLFKFVELEDFLSRKIGVKIDLVMKDALKLRIKEQILKETIYI